MDSQIIVPLFILIIATVGFSIYYYNTKQTVLRALSKLKPKTQIQFKANEAIKVSGIANAIKVPLEAPFSKRKCVAYSIKIEQKKQIGKNKHWKTLVHKEVIQDFLVNVNGMQLMVKPKSAPKDYLSYFVADKKVTTVVLNAPSHNFETVLETYNITSKNMLGLNKKMRYTERVLELGDIVTIGGVVKWERLDIPLQGYNYSKIATTETQGNQKLIITDLPEAVIN